MPMVLLLGGLVALVLGAECFVRGASRIAARLGVPSLVIGLTVVSIGTSAPEIAISTQGALSGRSDLAVGNAVGSNIFNLLFILGLSALIAPLVVARQLVRLDVPLLVLLSVLVCGLAWNGVIGRLEGGLLLLLGVGYSALLVHQALRAPRVDDQFDREYRATGPPGLRGWTVNLVLGVVGLTLLIVGCGWFVSGAVEVARSMGISELVIGLTIVAAGTSLPEVATSVVATIRGERDIAVGNVMGSCIYNLFLVVGLAAAIVPEGLAVSQPVLRLDLPVMVAVAIACLPIVVTGHRIDRWEGALFLVCYLLYVGWLVAESLAHPTWIGARGVAVAIALPLIVATLGVVVWRSRAQPRSPPG